MGMQYDVSSAVATSDGTMVAYRARVKGMVITSSASAGSVVLKDGGSGGTSLVTINTPATASVHNVLLPGEGVLFESSIYVDLTNVTSVTVFYG